MDSNTYQYHTVKLPLILFTTLVIILLADSCSSLKVEDRINGGFEYIDEDGNNPIGWFANRFPQSGKYVSFKIDNNIFHSGDRSVSIELAKSQPEKISIYKWVGRVEGLNASESYELNGWIKTSKIETSPYIEVQCWDEKMLIADISTEKQFPIRGTTGWKEVNSIFRIPEKTVKVLVIAAVKSEDNNSGTVWFDDIQIKKSE